MSRSNIFCAVILSITYIQFCNTEITIEDVDVQTTGSYNTQSSEEWFDPMKQKENQTVEELFRMFGPDALSKGLRTIPEDNDETDEIEVEDNGESSTIRTQDLNKSVILESEHDTTEMMASESTTSNISTKLENETGDVLQLPIAAGLSSNEQSKMFVTTVDTVAAPVSQIYSENTIYQATAPDRIGTANNTDDSNSTEDSSVENQTIAIITTTPIPTIVKTKPKPPRPTPRPKIYKYNAESILRRFLDDPYIRKPMAALIDTSPDTLRKTKLLWKSALRPNSALDIVLVAFNASGKVFLVFFLISLLINELIIKPTSSLCNR